MISCMNHGTIFYYSLLDVEATNVLRLNFKKNGFIEYNMYFNKQI